MKRIILSYLISLFFLLGIGNNVFGQAVGDYGSTAASGTPGTMDWLTGTWYVCTSEGTWAGYTTTTTPPDQTKNVWILAGDIVNLTSATFVQGKCKNLEVAGSLTLVDAKVENTQVHGNIHVASTGTITANPKFIWGNYSTSAISLTVDAGGVFLLKDQFKPYGANGATTTITNNGILGASTAITGAGATIYMINQSSAVGNSNVIFTGTGTTIFRRLYADTNAGSFNITFDQNVKFSPASTDPGIKLQNASGVTATSTRNITINAGKTVTISSGWFANNATAFTGVDANNTFNINGTLDASAASTYFGCTTNTTADQRGAINSQIINIGSTGMLKCGSVVSVNKPQSGQTLAVNVAEGGKITYAGTAYQTLPTTSTYAVTASPYALLTNSNSNLSFTNATSAVTLNSDLSVSGNLVLSAAGTWSGTGKTVMTGAGKTISGGTLGALEISTGAIENIVTTSAALTANGDITVTSGTLTMGADITTYNISVASGAVLTTNIGANSFSRRTLKVGNGAANNDATVTVNGTLGGAKWSADGIDIQVSANAKSCTIGGSGGTIAISGLRPSANANSRVLDIYLNQNMYIDRDNGGAANLEPALTLQNGTCTFARTLTVPENVTVTLRGNCGLHGLRNATTSADELINNYASSTSDQGNCTYNINGTLDLTIFNAICNLNTTSFSGNTQSVTVNVGSTGTLKLANIVKMYTALSGQSASIVPATGSTIEYGYNGTPTLLLTTGSGTVPTLPATYSNLKINNISGITLPASATVNESLILTAGTLATGANALTLKGSISGSGTINTGASGTLAFGGSSEQTLAASNLASGSVNNLTINAGSKLNTTGSITATVINILSSASGTGTLINGGTLTNTNASVQQYLPDVRNWYVSSPVSNTLAPTGFTYYKYSESASNWPSVAVNDALDKGTGYIALPGSTASTLTFTTQLGGTLNSGNVDVSLTHSGATKTGFNLIGNPYPCHLGWTYDFVNANSALIESSIWIRTNAGTTNNSGQWSFATYNASSSESVPLVANNGIIAPMQAFWVRAKTAGTLTLNSNLTKSHQSSNPLKVRAATNDDRQRIRLEVSNGTATDESLIFFDTAASNGYDNYDSPKMANNNVDIPEIYTMVNGRKLVMNGMNGIVNDMEIPIGFTTGKSNAFTLKTTQLSNLDADVKVYLKDNNNVNSLTELNLNEEYTFTSDITENITRFSLVFKAPSITTADNFVKNNSVRVFSNENNRILVENNLNFEDATMMVYNFVGQLKETKKLTGHSTISGLSYDSGVYFVAIRIGDKIETTKLVMNNI